MDSLRLVQILHWVRDALDICELKGLGKIAVYFSQLN